MGGFPELILSQVGESSITIHWAIFGQNHYSLCNGFDFHQLEVPTSVFLQAD